MNEEYRRSDRYVYRSIAGEDILISLQRTTVSPMCVLTPSAVLLWERMLEWVDTKALAAALMARFEVSTEQANADVCEFLEQLAYMRAVESRERSAK